MIDKRTAARKLIHTSIRNFFSDECPVSNHVVIMSAFDLLREYAAKAKTDYLDIGDHFKDEFRTQAIKEYVKGAWYFLKHTDKIEDKLDDYRIRSVNPGLIFLNCANYKRVFGLNTFHMALHMIYVGAENPDWLRKENKEKLEKQVGSLLKVGPTDRIMIVRNALEQNVAIVQERYEDLS